MAKLKSPPECSMDALLSVLMGQWTLMILWTLRQENPIRFNALRKRLPGISAKILTARLRLLEEEGILTRHIEPTNPPQVSYQLSEKGCELIHIMDQLHELAKHWYENNGETGNRTT